MTSVLMIGSVLGQAQGATTQFFPVNFVIVAILGVASLVGFVAFMLTKRNNRS